MNHRKANRMTVGFHREQHGMTRIDIDTGIPFAQFVAAAENAPNDLMVYAKIDASDFLSLAGHRTQAIEDLVGNHVIAETMFRHDAKALLYAPLRMLIYSDADGDAV